MPLDARKTAKAQALVTQSWTGRMKTVTFVTKNSGAGFTYTNQTVIFKPIAAVDPTVYDRAGHQAIHHEDMIMYTPLTLSLTGLYEVADTVTATAAGVAAANKYEIIEILQVGLIAGGTHNRVSLRRLR